jgi:hypothetical protein
LRFHQFAEKAWLSVRLSLRKLTFSIVPNSDSAIVSILFLLQK